jgi:hypothetical protein
MDAPWKAEAASFFSTSLAINGALIPSNLPRRVSVVVASAYIQCGVFPRDQTSLIRRACEGMIQVSNIQRAQRVQNIQQDAK